MLAAASCVVTPLAQGEAVVPLDACRCPRGLPMPWFPTWPTSASSSIRRGWRCSIPIRKAVCRLWKVVGALAGVGGHFGGAAGVAAAIPYLFVGWFWYLGMLVPVIGLVQVGLQAMADRYTYLPQIGLCIALAWGVADVVASWPLSSLGVRRRLGVGGAGADGCALAADVVLARQRDALDPRLGLHRAKRRRPQQPRQRLGRSRTDSTRPSPSTRRPWKSSPTMPRPTTTSVSLLASRGQLDEAIAHYQKALKIKPDYAEAHNNLGNALAGRGQVDEAIAHYQKALELKPDYAEAHNNLGTALAGRGQIDEAIAHYQKALESSPTCRDARQSRHRCTGSDKIARRSPSGAKWSGYSPTTLAC